MHLHRLFDIILQGQISSNAGKHHSQDQYDDHDGAERFFVFITVHIKHEVTSCGELLYMLVPILTTIIILVLLMQIALRKSNREMDHALDDFWAKENAANNVRRKSLDDLEYLSIPDEFYEYPCDPDSHDAAEAMHILENLRGQKIVNLTGISNTDLKLSYGTANITVLAVYDQNYTMLVRALQMYAEYFYRLGDTERSKKLMEYAVSTRTDIGASYKLLADIYAEQGTPERISELIETVRTLHTPTTPATLRALEEKMAKPTPADP